MYTQRRRFGTDQTATILKRYLVDKVPISDLCDEFGIKPNQIYAWQNILVDNLEAIFHPAAKRAARRKSSQPAIANWPRPANVERSSARRPACGRLPDRTKDATMSDGLGGE